MIFVGLKVQGESLIHEFSAAAPKRPSASGSEQGTPRAITDLDAPPRVRGDDDGDGRGFESPRVFFREVICARATPATFLIDGFCYILE